MKLPSFLKIPIILLIFNKSQSETERQSDFERVLQMVDPDMTGQVTFQAFMDFMTQEASDMDTAEQIIASFRVLAGDKVGR